jgi:flagellar protein FlaG
MQIQSVGSPVTTKLEERAAPAVDQKGVVASVAGKARSDAPEPSKDDVSKAVKKLNESMLGAAQSLEFSIDEDTKGIVVKVIDQTTKEVVRQMPSKEALEISKSLDKMRGLLINQTA